MIVNVGMHILLAWRKLCTANTNLDKEGIKKGYESRSKEKRRLECDKDGLKTFRKESNQSGFIPALSVKE